MKGGATIETFTPTTTGADTSQTVSRSGGGANFQALSNSLNLTIDPTSNLSDNTVYELVIPSGSIALKKNNGTPDILSGAITITFSTGTAPTLISSSPSDGGVASALTGNLTMTFDRNVVGGIGIVTLYKKANGNNYSVVETFNAATGVGGSGGSIAFSGATVTLNPYADLLASGEYAIGVEPGAIRDTNGITFAGISDYTTLNFTTTTGSVSGSCPASGTALAYMNAQLDSLSNSLAGGGLTSACYSDAMTAAESSTAYTVGYFCAVYATNLNPGLAVAWSGNLHIAGSAGVVDRRQFALQGLPVLRLERQRYTEQFRAPRSVLRMSRNH